MSQRQDAERSALKAKGYTGALRDMELRFLQDHSGPPPVADALPDAWVKFLEYQTGQPVRDRADAELIFLQMVLPAPTQSWTLLDGWMAFWLLGGPLLQP